MSKTKKIIVEYIWIGGNSELRSKTRVLNVTDDEYNDCLNISLPEWNYDGSSTCQASGSDTEVIIKPQKICRCPFRRNGNNLLALCDTYDSDGVPLPTNTRYHAAKIFEQKPEEDIWFGNEQELFFMDAQTNLPLGANGEIPTKMGQYYCSVGALNAFGRPLAEEALDNMLFTGLTISGTNYEVSCAQFECQVGPCSGINSGDEHIMMRYILERTAEKYNVWINYHPKPFPGINGSGCHVNISTKKMREENGLEEIMNAIKKLEAKHMEHMAVYGKYNEMRMSGKHETSSFDRFNYSIGGRHTSIRVGNGVHKDKKGYFEDRRPSSNCDPYIVTSKIFETICL
jgi:glutamine synthetase